MGGCPACRGAVCVVRLENCECVLCQPDPPIPPERLSRMFVRFTGCGMVAMSSNREACAGNGLPEPDSTDSSQRCLQCPGTLACNAIAARIPMDHLIGAGRQGTAGRWNPAGEERDQQAEPRQCECFEVFHMAYLSGSWAREPIVQGQQSCRLPRRENIALNLLDNFRPARTCKADSTVVTSSYCNEGMAACSQRPDIPAKPAVAMRLRSRGAACGSGGIEARR